MTRRSLSLVCEVEGRRKDGSHFPALLSVGVMRWGENTQFTSIVRDLTEQKRTAAALDEERSVIHELMQNLTEAVYIYFKDEHSRFLRINAALARKLGVQEPREAIGKTDFDFFPEEYARKCFREELEILRTTELALDTDLAPEQREYLQMVKSSGDQLLHIINDILDFSKIEAGKLELDPHEFLLRDSLGEMLRTLAHRADFKGLELAARIAPNVPDSLIGDAARLRQIVVKLVGNSIQFTE